MMGALINKHPQGHQRCPFSFWLKWIYFTTQKTLIPIPDPAKGAATSDGHPGRISLTGTACPCKPAQLSPYPQGGFWKQPPKLRSSTSCISKAAIELPSFDSSEDWRRFSCHLRIHFTGHHPRLHLPLPLVRNVDSGLPSLFCCWAGQHFSSLI